MSSTPSILVYDFNHSTYDRRRLSASSRSAARNLPFRSLSTSPGPMAIPNAMEPVVPPPLPPPRYIEDLAIGHDSGWKWGNSVEEGEFGKPTLPPIKPSSSLVGGGHTRPELVRRTERVTLDKEIKRSNMMSTAKISPVLKNRTSFWTLGDSTFPSSSNPSLPSPCLQGEKPLSEKSVERSSNAYDQHLLSKIGKPSSPPRLPSSLGGLGQREFTTLPFHSKNRKGLSSLSIGDGSLSPRDPASRWTSGPQSAGISPGTRPGWADYVSYRSPSVDSPPHQPDFDHFRDRNLSPGTHHTNDDSTSMYSRSNRGSYDQNVFPDSDIDFPMDETTQHRQLSVDDRGSSQLGSMSPLSRQGMKRRASSPPRGAVSDELHALHTTTSNGDLEQRRTSGFPFSGCVSPGARYQPSHGSISSVSSTSLRTGSYASSTGLSVAASSLTSLSSFDRHSPGGISPTSELESSYEKAFVSLGVRKSLSGLTSSRTPHHRDQVEVKSAPPIRNMSLPNNLSVSKTAPPRINRLHICECCPKKPKKFETSEELLAHEMEKQYTCQFCNKRFKNKNEAERHQNSLHLRRHSWSCAALSGVEAAFHPSASPTCQSPTGPSHDTCGYCGDEFNNFPQPDWDRRIDHLISVHKFGECNQAKKFYRADHFRQHLKHSHAGASGKWTNILENACMKEESSTEGGLASIGEHGGRNPENQMGETGNMDIESGPTPGTRMSHTIDKIMEEP
ncbi:conserved hypothetical protein [Histoplasma capsulatum G186AR]|uniref:C2H2-type domain-containing protein n=2 Tax=Ajellomyces capsulatus TaxID=5037 RepID=C0NIR6_AJECG|nr:uncharacterized protein HCBG_02323 [Histoplasma capsulatum G186AR]EEH08786.1 conserved hypothetical protein [Histoplasma capsulatum G186AR]